jgi:hypothetical protein
LWKVSGFPGVTGSGTVDIVFCRGLDFPEIGRETLTWRR